MAALLDLYLSKNRGDRKIVDSIKGEAVRKTKTKKKKQKQNIQEKETGDPPSSALQPQH